MGSPESVCIRCISDIIWTEQVLFRTIYMHIYAIIVNKNVAINLKKSRDGYMIRFKGRIDNGEMFQLNYSLENEHTH